MEYNKEDIKRLTAQVEKVVGKKISGPRDFDFLSRQVEGYTGETLSVSTLKRVWGYIPSGSRLSRYSLDVLASMAGYAGWEAYVAGVNGGDVSFRIVHRKLFTDSLEYGDRVKLVWSPDRVVTIRYEGQNMFTVVESENSKLCVGDTFRCGLFVDHEPLYLTGLFHPGMPVSDYVCGKSGGVIWHVLDKPDEQ